MSIYGFFSTENFFVQVIFVSNRSYSNEYSFYWDEIKKRKLYIHIKQNFGCTHARACIDIKHGLDITFSEECTGSNHISSKHARACANLYHHTLCETHFVRHSKLWQGKQFTLNSMHCVIFNTTIPFLFHEPNHCSIHFSQMNKSKWVTV